VAVTRIPIKYGKLSWLLRLCLVPPRSAYVERDSDEIVVRMGWAFLGRFRSDAVVATKSYDRRISVGVHGWRGRWLVNGATEPVVGLLLREPVRAYVMGFPIRLREVLVSVDDPGALLRLVATA